MSEIVRRLERRTAEGPSSLRETQDRELRIHVSAESRKGMKKRARVTLEQPVGSTFEINCDEGAYLGGEDSAPPPLSYFSAAVAF
jgi:hypothetical protein